MKLQKTSNPIVTNHDQWGVPKMGLILSMGLLEFPNDLDDLGVPLF